MTDRNRFDRLLVVAVLAAVAALTLGGAAVAGPQAPTVPADVAVGAGHKVFLVGHAEGVQIHTCTADASAYRWTFVGPRANLYDEDGKLLMTHGSGPSWQTRDGSKIVAALDGRVTVDPAAIPWFRLFVTQRFPGADGDRLGATTYIQRIKTTGGLAPAASTCSAATLGTTVEVPYTADYVFWKAAG